MVKGLAGRKQPPQPPAPAGAVCCAPPCHPAGSRQTASNDASDDGHDRYPARTLAGGDLRVCQRITESRFNKAWRKARLAGGCPGNPHDFRRTAVRHSVRAGVLNGSRCNRVGTRPARCSSATTSSARATFERPRSASIGSWPAAPGHVLARRVTTGNAPRWREPVRPRGRRRCQLFGSASGVARRATNRRQLFGECHHPTARVSNPCIFWLECCIPTLHETSTSRIVTLSVAARMCACSACAGFIRLSHGRAASCASRVPRPAAARARLRVGRRLLVPGERPVSVAQRLLDAPPVS